jgi:hypothetical protein
VLGARPAVVPPRGGLSRDAKSALTSPSRGTTASSGRCAGSSRATTSATAAAASNGGDGAAAAPSAPTPTSFTSAPFGGGGTAPGSPPPSPAPTPEEECGPEGDAYRQCVEAYEEASSDSSVNKGDCTVCTLSQDRADTCEKGEFLACSLMNLCPSFGPCQAAFLPFWNCLIPDYCGNLTCDSDAAS